MKAPKKRGHRAALSKKYFRSSADASPQVGRGETCCAAHVQRASPLAALPAAMGGAYPCLSSSCRMGLWLRSCGWLRGWVRAR
jgi:hypothetical protein